MRFKNIFVIGKYLYKQRLLSIKPPYGYKATWANAFERDIVFCCVTNLYDVVRVKCKSDKAIFL